MAQQVAAELGKGLQGKERCHSFKKAIIMAQLTVHLENLEPHVFLNPWIILGSL